MSLLVTYPPREDESGLGYYRRLAEDNVLAGWRELAGLAGVQPTRSALLAHADFVAERLGIEAQRTHVASEQETAARRWSRLQRAQADAVCPECLAQDSYLRHYWSHTYVIACPYHKIQLIDRCDHCGELLSPNRDHIGRCNCGHDLQALPRLSATRSQVWLSTLIASDGKNTGGVEPALRKVDVIILGQAVGTLCISAEPTHPPLHRSAALPKTVAEAIGFLAPLETLLAQWPDGFKEHVAQRIAAGKPEARTLNTLLGPWYVSLRKNCKDTALEPFVQAIIEVAAEKFDGILGLDSAKALAEEATDYLRAPDAAKNIGVSVSRLHKALEDGACRYRARRMGTRGQIYEIPRDEVTRIAQQRRHWISDCEACEWAGVQKSVLDNMIAARVIRADVRWREDILKGGLVQRSSLEELFERLRAATTPSTTDEEETLTWAGLTSRRMGDKRAIQAAMQAISEGSVKPIAHGRKLGEMVFQRSDVASYFGTPVLEAGMSIQQLSKLTGWKWESIAHWIEEGLLDSQSIMLRGRPCRVVLPEHLLAFRQNYVPLADLARGMGTKSSALSRLLPGIDLVGARELPGGAMRGGLIRLTELGQLAILGARAGQDLFVSAAPISHHSA